MNEEEKQSRIVCLSTQSSGLLAETVVSLEGALTAAQQEIARLRGELDAVRGALSRWRQWCASPDIERTGLLKEIARLRVLAGNSYHQGWAACASNQSSTVGECWRSSPAYASLTLPPEHPEPAATPAPPVEPDAATKRDALLKWEIETVEIYKAPSGMYLEKPENKLFWYISRIRDHMGDRFLAAGDDELTDSDEKYCDTVDDARAWCEEGEENVRHALYMESNEYDQYD